MKKIVLLLFLICIARFIFAQSIPETLIYRDSVLLFAVHNNQVITITQLDDSLCLLSVNNKTDTLNFAPKKWRNITAYNNSQNIIYFADNLSRRQVVENVYQLNLDTKNIVKIRAFTNSYSTYIIDNYIIRSSDFDCEDDYNCSYLLFHNMDNNVVDTLELRNYYYSNLIVGNKILLEYYESGSVIEIDYYDWNNKKCIWNVPALDSLRPEVIKVNESFIYTKNDISDIDYSYDDITGKYSNIGIYWIDSNFNLIQPTLKSYPNRESSSSNIDTYYYRYSYIEGEKGHNYVWIACKFTLPFDKALYDIYYNTLLEKTTIEKFDKWELNKLRNMIFAKHGYQFQSEYLQAFFNLFDFYNNIKKTSDINALLTPIDKKNLELIQGVENKLIKK
jgi:hypothetical protein